MVTKASHKTGLIKTTLITSAQFREPDDRGHFYTIYPSPLHGVFQSSMKVLVRILNPTLQTFSLLINTSDLGPNTS